MKGDTLPKIAPVPQVPKDGWNRNRFRGGGLQGRKHSTLVVDKTRMVKGIDDKPQENWRGIVRRSFYRHGRMPALYLTHSKDWLTRAVRRQAVSNGKLKREIARARARGEL